MKFKSRDPKSLREIENFERSKVREIESKFAELYREKVGTRISLREIENFERTKFELSRVTCTYYFPLKLTIKGSIKEKISIC
jgi:hypothetical protein